ncbi:hypothetical protein Tco_0417339 [Tanacetum coccineum]
MKTPMSSDTKLTKDEQCEHRGMIGSLLYLTASRPDIMFSVCLCARFQEDPKTSHLEAVTMSRVTVSDHKNTRSYIPNIPAEFTPPLRYRYEFIENRYINEGRVVHRDFDDMVYLQTIFGMIGFKCLLTISEKIIPRFVLEFYSQLCLNYNSEGQIVPSSGLYQTTPPTPDEIKLYVQVEREDPLTRIRHDQVIDVEENQILTREIIPIMKTWVDIICENVFCLGGNRDHVPGCLCHMLYCIATTTNYNLAFFVAKRMELATKQTRLILPYGMLLTRLFSHVMSNNPELSNDRYIFYDRVMYPLAAQYERKTQKDYSTKRGRHSTSASSSFAFGQPSSSHHIDDDNDGNDEGTSRASTPSSLIFSILCQMIFYKSFQTHLITTQTWKPSSFAKPKF